MAVAQWELVHTLGQDIFQERDILAFHEVIDPWYV